MAATIKIVVSSSASGSALSDTRRDVEALEGAGARGAKGFDLLKTAGVAAFAAVAAGAVAAGKFLADSVGMAASFESGMLQFGAAAGKGFEQGTEKLDEFHDLFLDLGKKLPVSTAEVQQAAIALVKGGLDPAVIKAGALEKSLQFAAAAGMDLEAAAELTVKQLGTFVDVGASVEEQTEFMAESQELLVKAAGASTLNVDALGDAMLAAGGQVKASGMEYEDFVTTMGLISPAFGSAAEAGTSFKNFLVRLNPSTAAAKETMIALGLATEDGTSKFYDAEGRFVGMRQASEMLQGAFSGLTDQEKIMALQTMFGNDAMGAANALLSAGSEGYDEFAAKMEAANGVAGQSAAVQQGLAFAWENFKGSVEALQITLGEMLLPTLTALVNNYLTPLVNKVMELVSTFDFASLGSLDLVAALAQISPVFGLLLGVIQKIIPQVKFIVMEVFSDIQAFWAQNGAMMIGQAQTTWGSIQATIQAIINAIVPVVQAFLVQLLLFWNAHGEEIMAVVQVVWTEINSIIQLAMQLIQATIVPMLQYIASFISQHSAEIQGILTVAWETIKTLVLTALSIIKGIITAALAIVKGDWQTAWTAIKGVAQTIWEGIKALLKLNLDLITILFKQVWTDLKVFFQGILDGMVGWVLQTLQGIVNALNSFAGTAKSAAGSIGSAIVNGITSGIESGASAIISAAKNAAMDALNAAKAALGIGSPSKLFAQAVGLPMAQGMALGLAGGAPMVAGAAAYTAGAGYAGAASTVNNQRSMSLTQNYYGVPAAPSMDFATANSLAGV